MRMAERAMGSAERAAYERWQLGRRLHPGATRLEFKNTPSGRVVTPDYRGKAGRNKTGSWQGRLVDLEQRLLALELKRIAKTL